MAEYMSKDGYEFIFRKFIVPEAKETVFSKLTDRHVIGSVNDLIHMAKFYLIERQMSPFETSQEINQAPMTYIGYDNPKKAFTKIKPIIENEQEAPKT